MYCIAMWLLGGSEFFSVLLSSYWGVLSDVMCLNVVARVFWVFLVCCYAVIGVFYAVARVFWVFLVCCYAVTGVF